MRGIMFNNTEGTGNALVTDISRVAHDVSHATINNYAQIVDICGAITGLPTGTTGNTGAQGPIGPNGTQGTTAAQGPTGIQGIIGAQGPDGGQGLQGPAGSGGGAGPQGYQGSQGSQGSAGGVTFGGSGIKMLDPASSSLPAGLPNTAQTIYKILIVGAGGYGGGQSTYPNGGGGGGSIMVWLDGAQFAGASYGIGQAGGSAGSVAGGTGTADTFLKLSNNTEFRAHGGGAGGSGYGAAQGGQGGTCQITPTSVLGATSSSTFYGTAQDVSNYFIFPGGYGANGGPSSNAAFSVTPPYGGLCGCGLQPYGRGGPSSAQANTSPFYIPGAQGGAILIEWWAKY